MTDSRFQIPDSRFQPRSSGHLESGTWNLESDEKIWSGGGFDPKEFFGREAPLEVEIGSGKARFLIAAATSNPAHDFLGLERSLSYYRICRDRIVRSGLSNAGILRADGRLLVRALRPDSVRAIHIYFPDPWPKRKQKKRRLLDSVTLELLASRLEPGGTLRIATDHPDYGHAIGPSLATVVSLQRLDWSALPPPPPTNYEIKYTAQGRPIWRFLCVRRET
jgi:tRNA (guanine-N7-)-methyltransferase